MNQLLQSLPLSAAQAVHLGSWHGHLLLATAPQLPRQVSHEVGLEHVKHGEMHGMHNF